MATVVGITVIKRFSYRGDASEEFSNQYWLTGSVPSSSANWKTLVDALIAQEKTIYLSNVEVIRAYGYDSDADNAVSVWSNDYLAAAAQVPGTLTVGSSVIAPGDAAVWCKWRTSRTNTRGKPIYLRKYFHGARLQSGSADTAFSGQVTALQAFATKLWDGSFAEARTIRSRLHSETITASGASPYVTTRTLKRRGRRPTS